MRITEEQTSSRLSPDARQWLRRSGRCAIAGIVLMTVSILLPSSVLTEAGALSGLALSFAAFLCLSIVPALPLVRWLRKRDYEQPDVTPTSIPAPEPISPAGPRQSELRQSLQDLSTDGKLKLAAIVSFVMLMCGFVLQVFVEEKVLPELAGTLGQSVSFCGVLGLFVVFVLYVATRFKPDRNDAGESQPPSA